jgi:aryl-alcohol dehydrogenase-like predicted oxidoreductase
VNKRKLGKSDLEVSLVGIGCNNFGQRIDDATARKVVDAALEHGITLFDTADIYGGRGGSETTLGKILGARRKDIVLASKFGMPMDDAGTMKGASRAYIMSSVEGSLRRLKTDWIDLYQVHQPDALTPIEETLRALDDLVRSGKVRYIGCSNYAAWQVVEAAWTARQAGTASFISCQDEYSLLARGIEKELIPAMRSYGLGLLPYFPLASGLLTGKYRRNAALPEGSRMELHKNFADRFLSERNWQQVERLGQFCARRGRSMLELAFSWLAAQPTVASVIAGATRPEQIAQNAAAAGWTLNAEDLAELDRL